MNWHPIVSKIQLFTFYICTKLRKTTKCVNKMTPWRDLRSGTATLYISPFLLVIYYRLRKKTCFFLKNAWELRISLRRSGWQPKKRHAFFVGKVFPYRLSFLYPFSGGVWAVWWYDAWPCVFRASSDAWRGLHPPPRRVMLDLAYSVEGAPVEGARMAQRRCWSFSLAFLLCISCVLWCVIHSFPLFLRLVGDLCPLYLV